MDVILDPLAGFCYGVKRAIDLARKLKTTYDVVYTDGPLIHNETMIQELEGQKICSCSDPLLISKITDKDLKQCLLIRAHGISPERRCWLKSLNLPLADATCPDVGKIAGTVLSYARKGYVVLIYGSPDHPEAIGLLGYTNNYSKGFIITKPEDLKNLPLLAETKICLVSQSTMSVEKFSRLADFVKGQFQNTIVKDTICKSTRSRQEGLLHLIQDNNLDCMIIVGGYNSSNTHKLVELAQKHVTTYHIETSEDLKNLNIEWHKVKKIGVSAGASTPPGVISSVVSYLQNLSQVGCKPNSSGHE